MSEVSHQSPVCPPMWLDILIKTHILKHGPLLIYYFGLIFSWLNCRTSKRNKMEWNKLQNLHSWSGMREDLYYLLQGYIYAIFNIYCLGDFICIIHLLYFLESVNQLVGLYVKITAVLVTFVLTGFLLVT